MKIQKKIARSSFLSFQEIAERERAEHRELAPRPLFIIRTRLSDGAFRYFNVIETTCPTGCKHVLPVISDTHYYGFFNREDARARLKALKEIDQLGGVELFKRGRIIQLFSYPQYN